MSESQESKCKKSAAVMEIIDNDKNTQLHYYAAHGNIDEFRKTYTKDHKIDVENYLGWTPLMMACHNGHLEMVKLLLELNADASKSNKFDYSVILISITSGNKDIVVLILQHLLCGGISRNNMQNVLSPLSLAILFGHHEIFQYLLTQHFDLNVKTPITGLTPLMFAAGMEDVSSFTTLLNKNADADIKNFLGFTARDIQNSKRITNSKKSKSIAQADIMVNSPQISPYPQVPQIVCNNAAYPNFVCLTPHLYFPQQLRRSSNVFTPSPNFYLATSGVSPIPPFTPVSPHIFFPPDFSFQQCYPISPVTVPSHFNNNNFLDITVNDMSSNSQVSSSSFLF